METHADNGAGDDAFAVDDPGERPARSKKRRTKAKPAWPTIDDVDFRIGLAGESRAKENLLLSRAFIAVLEQARLTFTLSRPEWMLEHGATPGISAFREGLLRLGLKHVNDPELFTLIPPDGRRRKTAPVDPPNAAPLTPATPGDLPEIAPVDHLAAFDEPRTKDSVTMPESLLIEFRQTTMTWAMAHPEWLMGHGDFPGKAGFREGLLRLGLKHINDPELAELIPGDQRRRS